jgi:hypothetical protein
MTGKNKMTAEDPLTALVERFVLGEAGFRTVNVEKHA